MYIQCSHYWPPPQNYHLSISRPPSILSYQRRYTTRVLRFSLCNNVERGWIIEAFLPRSKRGTRVVSPLLSYNTKLTIIMLTLIQVYTSLYISYYYTSHTIYHYWHTPLVSLLFLWWVIRVRWGKWVRCLRQVISGQSNTWRRYCSVHWCWTEVAPDTLSLVHSCKWIQAVIVPP